MSERRETFLGERRATSTDELRISVVIPYRDRADNLRLALTALAAQSLPVDRFEVIVGVLDDGPEHLEILQEFTGRLDVVAVTSGRPWQVGYARNLALRQAGGEVVVLMDVDMVLPSRCLEDLYDRHFGYGQRICVVGQMIDYDNNTGDVTEVEAQPYEHYRKVLDDLQVTGTGDQDPRMSAAHVIPWSFAWTALIALPRSLVVEQELWFDLGFHGYGVEDLEWAYRVARTGTPIVMGRDFFGVHLPHVRSVAANKRTEAPNYRYFLRKWPGVDVELACAFGDFEANELYPEFRRAVEAVAGASGGVLTVVRGTVDGRTELAVGVPAGTTGVLPATATGVEVLPITGLALPYPDGSIDRCHVLGPVTELPERYRERILAEVRRVAAPASPGMR
ncbi:glycosyltransferase [Actinoplanes sp. NEAU-A12]|uniref:Glycosyltransferase n=1 Tax=Actinoplanes sandaracinus TaxID=3045177 RepID=A0ABT6X0B3_9ACTN|nr:glycosyltransferase [Actinoplanes sandaracinus]MDI6105397.1 glycosyltransferase [Actinoplanes sandaracinus]